MPASYWKDLAEERRIKLDKALEENKDLSEMLQVILNLKIYCREIYLRGFSKISNFQERVLMEHTDMKNSLESKLQTYSKCSKRTHSKNRDIIDKPLQQI